MASEQAGDTRRMTDHACAGDSCGGGENQALEKPSGSAEAAPALADSGSERAYRYVFRPPAVNDATAMLELVQATDSLEPNSAYSYVMMADRFPETCVVAERDGKPVGFLSAFISTERDDTVFVWQVGVAPSEQGQGIARQMLQELLRRPACQGVRFLEATVTPSNEASAGLFRSLARALNTGCQLDKGFEKDCFPEGEDHEPERLFRVGPFSAAQVAAMECEESALEVFDRYESNVRAYCRGFPTVFERAQGCRLWDEEGREYLDFFDGAGALNYGHNPPRLKEALIEYIASDGITHGLDMATTAKRRFLERFHEVILEPRAMSYRVAFPGPTGTNAVECALKLARKATGRQTVIGFTNAFHGMTLGSLAVTGNGFKRAGAGVPLLYGAIMPYDGYIESGGDSIEYMERVLEDEGSGVDHPAAVIVETLQGEGGLNAAGYEWLRRLEALCRRHNMLLIVDDVQAGCGRTGPFFSFEPAGISPDIVCLSKSLSGYGLPMALTLVKPEHDHFAPGEHNGTFRGNNLAFVTASAALDFWETDELNRHVDRMGVRVRSVLQEIARERPVLRAEVRGRGLLNGMAIGVEGLAESICRAAFERGLLLETSGPESEVVKVMPPLVIDEADLDAGLEILRQAIADVLAESASGDRTNDAA